MIPTLAAAVLSYALGVRAARSQREIVPVVETFVEALRARDGARLAEVAPQSVGSAFALISAADLMERSRCAVIDAYAFNIDSADEQTASVTIALDGSAESIGSAHLRFALPRLWALSLIREGNRWMIARAETRDWMIGRLMAQAADDAARQRLLESADDPRAAVRAAAEIDSRVDVRSLDLMHFAEQWAEAQGDLATVAFVQRRRSRLFMMTHRSAAAIEEAKRSLCTAEESGDPNMKAEGFFGIAISSWLGGKETEALRALAQVAAMLKSLEDPRPAIRAVYMSEVIVKTHDPRAALSFLTKSDELSTAYDWYRGNVDAAMARGELYSSIGDVDSASHWYQIAAAQCQRLLDPVYTVAAHTGLAMCSIERGKLHEASVQLERLLRFSPGGEVAGQLGRVLARLGKYDEAERHLLFAIETSKKNEQWNLTALARTYLAELRMTEGHYDEALKIARAALEAATKPEKTKGIAGFAEWQTRLVAARALRRLHRPDEAMAMLQTTIDLVEQERASAATDGIGNARFFDDKIAPYTELADILLSRGRFRDALMVSERMRARSLRDALTMAYIDPATMMSESERRRERELEADLTRANRVFLESKNRGNTTMRDQRDESRAALNQFRADLFIKYPDLRIRRPLESAVSRESPRTMANVLFVEYAVREHNTLILTATRSTEGTIIVKGKRIAAGRGALSERIERFLSALSRRESDDADARALYELLVAPIESEIARHEVCIIPNGPLWRLPFHALTDRSGAFLIERRAIFYAPAMAMLARRAPRSAHAPRELLAMGDPRIDRVTMTSIREQVRGVTFTALPSAAGEVRGIARFYRAAATEVHTGAAARESTFKSVAADYRILHLATHGIADDSSPMYSSLLLARGQGDDEDGLLEAREIAAMSLHADIAVLSACDTARGRIGAGEGVTGLSWAFLAAGCPTTVVSQWSAESTATAELMVDFHRQLVQGVTAAEALRRAELDLMKSRRYHHPYYWAPFVVLGAP